MAKKFSTLRSLMAADARQRVAVRVAAETKKMAKSTERPAELVVHPSHYGGADNPYEHCRVADAWALSYALGSATKYICRAGKKGTLSDAVLDLKKAEFWVRHERERLEQLVAQETHADVPRNRPGRRRRPRPVD